MAAEVPEELPDSGWPGMDKLVQIVHDAETAYFVSRPFGAGYSRPSDDQIRRVITAIWPIAYRAAYEDFSRARANEEHRGATDGQ